MGKVLFVCLFIIFIHGLDINGSTVFRLAYLWNAAVVVVLGGDYELQRGDFL